MARINVYDGFRWIPLQEEGAGGGGENPAEFPPGSENQTLRYNAQGEVVVTSTLLVSNVGVDINGNLSIDGNIVTTGTVNGLRHVVVNAVPDPAEPNTIYYVRDL